MGLIISRFRRKKTTIEILEKLETNIKSIEKDGQYKEQAHKRIIGYMMAYSVGLYVLFAVLYYYMYAGRSQHWLHSLLYASPLLVLPVLVIFLRSGISWYYNWSLSKNRLKLNKMKEEKKKILEEVMNTETYKVAKEILDKYGSPDEHSRALKPFVPTQNVPGNSASPPATPGMLRQRQIMQTSTPISNNANANMNLMLKTSGPVVNGPRLRSEQLPRPLLDRNRSALDKVVDYLLKDGPNHRMALICTECHSHNGMALMEEFEYVAYNCAYCGKYHPARKQRPAAPALAAPPPRLAVAKRALPFTSVPPASTRSRAPNLFTPQPATSEVHARRLYKRTGKVSKESKVAGSGDDSSIASSASDSEEETLKRSCDSTLAATEVEELDRPPSPTEEAPKSDMEKKED